MFLLRQCFHVSYLFYYFILILNSNCTPQHLLSSDNVTSVHSDESVSTTPIVYMNDFFPATTESDNIATTNTSSFHEGNPALSLSSLISLILRSKRSPGVINRPCIPYRGTCTTYNGVTDVCCDKGLTCKPIKNRSVYYLSCLPPVGQR